MSTKLSDLRLDRRTLLAVLGAGAGAAGLAACGSPVAGGSGSSPNLRSGFSQAPTTVPSQYQGRTAVLFWAPFTGVNFEALQALFTKFNDSQSDIVAIAESQGGYTDLNKKFTAALQARQVPDIVCFPERQWLQFWQADALAPLDGYFDDQWSLDVYMQNYVQEGTAGGQTYVVPFARSTPLFYFNKTRFVEAGLPEEGPSTWEEFAEMAPELLKLDAGGQPLKPMAFGPDDTWYGQSHIWAWGGQWSSATEATADAGPAREWLSWKKNFIHTDGYGYMAQSSMTDFQTGVAAASHGSTASLRGATEAAQFDIGTAFMLGHDQAAPPVPTGGSGLSVVKAESQERQDACAELFRFLAEPENSAQWHLGTGYLPIVTAAQDTKEVKDQVAADPNFGTALEQVPNAKTADPVAWYQAATVEISAAMAQVYGDGADVDTVVSQLQAKLEDVMSQNQESIQKVLAS
ncbi:extracellular solute-binding protein [Auraticoccus sp. F435]|uniref:Extracellular solute-binding protein n=1 Tax=Auraticoccus cholistanensis TaxID=2656650 RepID=A0A6A9UXV9_9ACTN|nr:ABC transporter substrate-binding protein [Auraticoccus cholistanensis]MVA76474.1 extracellular solute-binding protein [Auraticoccus cholistanensis]